MPAPVYLDTSESKSSLELGGNVGLSLWGGKSEVGSPLSALGVLEDLEASSLGDNLLGWLGVALSLGSVWVGDDGRVDLLVEILAGLDLSSSKALLPLRELSLEGSGVLLLELGHVSLNMRSENLSSVDLGVEVGLSLVGSDSLSSLVLDLLNLSVSVSWESLGLMWNVDSTIASSLHDREDSSSGGGSVDTNIEESLEWSLVLNIVINVEVLSVDIGVALVHVGETNLLEKSSGEEKTGGISSRVVGKSSGETVLLELGGLSGAENSITSHGGVDDLADVLGASSSNDESVLLGVVLVLVLADKSSSGVVIGLALSSSLWLDLHS